MRTFALILGTLLLITACGTKGPLTLPPKPGAVAPPTADASTTAEGRR